MFGLPGWSQSYLRYLASSTAIRSAADIDAGVGKRISGGDVEAAPGQPAGDPLLAFGLFDPRQHAARGRRQAGVTNGIHRHQLRVCQPGRTEKARGSLKILEARVEQDRAPFDR